MFTPCRAVKLALTAAPYALYSWLRAFQRVEQVRLDAALCLHHDAITGTSRESVVTDYTRRMAEGNEDARALIADMASLVGSRDPTRRSSDASDFDGDVEGGRGSGGGGFVTYGRLGNPPQQLHPLMRQYQLQHQQRQRQQQQPQQQQVVEEEQRTVVSFSLTLFRSFVQAFKRSSPVVPV
jgi:hypothetical protein